ncbi:hypothetical protein ACER0A_000790 [Haloimpatiens sp. FM7315]|uniref:hypothetical protein n=1 Tax=Haloimpatiens sp. FM7315 TaxID=3298609 RepID=UPI0035A311C4
MKNNIEIDFDEFVNILNEKGKSEAVLLSRKKYDLSFQQVRRRLLKLTDYCYDSSQRIYIHKSKVAVDSGFMTIDELNSSIPKENTHKGFMSLSGHVPNSSFDELIKELIKDRLMELNKYVSINHETKTLIINTKNLKKDCFDLVEI